jgi:hypothetical protein
MPTFEVGLDDGRTIHIDAQDQDAALAGAQHFIANNPKRSSSAQNLPPLPEGFVPEDGSPWNDFRVSNSPQAVQINAAAIKHARGLGFSDDQIASHLADKYPTMLLDHLSGATQQTPPLPEGFQLESGSQPAAQNGRLMFDSLPKGPTRSDGSPLQFDDLPPLPNGFRLEQPTPKPSAAKDVATQVAGHLAEAPENIVSASANLASAISHAMVYGANKIAPNTAFVKNWNEQQADEDNRAAALQSIIPTVSKMVPKAQTGLGETAGSIADFAPAALLPGSALRRVLRTVVPGTASEGAGAVADQIAPDYAPMARMAAAVLAGGLTERGRAPSVDVDAARAATNTSYDTARSAGVTYDPQALAAAASAKKAALNKIGISEKSAPSAHDTLDSFIGNQSPMSLTDLEEHRQLINGDLSKGGKEAKAANAVKDVIDSVMSNPQNAVFWSGANSADAYAALQQGRSRAQALQRLKDIEGLQNNAEVTHNVHGTDLNKALKMQFGSVLKSDDTMRGFTNPDLLARMQSISKGSFPQGIAKKLGGGDLSHWSVPELAGLAFPLTMPAVVAMRTLGYGLSKSVDAKALAKVAQLKAAIAKQGGLPFTPAINPWPTRAVIGALAANKAAQQ